jgi:hypothetical protein
MAIDRRVRTYDPKKVLVTFGTISFEGYADGTFISMAQNGDNFEKVRGADGTVDRVNKNATDYAITVTLKQSSVTNDLLSVIAYADKETNAGVLPFVIADKGGTTLFFAESAWIGKEPDSEFSSDLSNREWRIDTGSAKKFDGGSLSNITS